VLSLCISLSSSFNFASALYRSVFQLYTSYIFHLTCSRNLAQLAVTT
jgi:hypothetical protein